MKSASIKWVKDYVTINWICYLPKKFTIVQNWKTDLSDLYNNASNVKRWVFNYRKEKLDCIYWLLWNSCTYSIYWQVTDENWKNHDVKITARHNYVLN